MAGEAIRTMYPLSTFYGFRAGLELGHCRPPGFFKKTRSFSLTSSNMRRTLQCFCGCGIQTDLEFVDNCRKPRRLSHSELKGSRRPIRGFPRKEVCGQHPSPGADKLPVVGMMSSERTSRRSRSRINGAGTDFLYQTGPEQHQHEGGKAVVPQSDGFPEPGTDSDDLSKCEESDRDSQTETSSEPSSALESTDDDNEEAAHASAGVLQTYREPKPNDKLDNRYKILGRTAGNKFNICFARLLGARAEIRVLKFYSDVALFKRSCKVHRKMRHSKHICTMFEATLQKENYPPYIVLDAGLHTLEEWLKLEDRSIPEKLCCLQQVLVGLYDLHRRKIVHCDISASNAVFCGKRSLWQLIDFDLARNVRERKSPSLKIHSAPPEALRCVQNEDLNFEINTSTDMWGFGVLAFETITGQGFCRECDTADEVLSFLESRAFEERLELVTDDCAQELVRKLLALDPRERWNAKRALKSDALRPFDTGLWS